MYSILLPSIEIKLYTQRDAIVVGPSRLETIDSFIDCSNLCLSCMACLIVRATPFLAVNRIAHRNEESVVAVLLFKENKNCRA